MEFNSLAQRRLNESRSVPRHFDRFFGEADLLGLAFPADEPEALDDGEPPAF